jgi:hypothetical protein
MTPALREQLQKSLRDYYVFQFPLASNSINQSRVLSQLGTQARKCLCSMFNQLPENGSLAWIALDGGMGSVSQTAKYLMFAAELHERSMRDIEDSVSHLTRMVESLKIFDHNLTLVSEVVATEAENVSAIEKLSEAAKVYDSLRAGEAGHSEAITKACEPLLLAETLAYVRFTLIPDFENILRAACEENPKQAEDLEREMAQIYEENVKHGKASRLPIVPSVHFEKNDVQAHKRIAYMCQSKYKVMPLIHGEWAAAREADRQASRIEQDGGSHGI